MKVLFDLNVLLDVLQKRRPHVQASARACAMAAQGKVQGLLPGHAATTIAYIVRRASGPGAEAAALSWLLDSFRVVGADHEDLLRARSYGMDDFEDAVVVATAVRSRCKVILTRNVADFQTSPVPSMTPEEFLSRFDPASPAET